MAYKSSLFQLHNLCRPLYREYYIIVASRAWNFGMNVTLFLKLVLQKRIRTVKLCQGKPLECHEYSECIKDYSVD